jgi:hypothetical protein
MPIIALNDFLIPEILSSSKHRIEADGTCWIVDHSSKQWRRWDRSRRHGYRYCSFKNKEVNAHRLVYAKFVGPLSMHLQINHKDGNPSNNHVSNLELVTQSENQLHRYRCLKRGPIIGNKKISHEIAGMIREQRKLGATYSELINQFGLCKSTISYVVNKRTWS